MVIRRPVVCRTPQPNFYLPEMLSAYVQGIGESVLRKHWLHPNFCLVSASLRRTQAPQHSMLHQNDMMREIYITLAVPPCFSHTHEPKTLLIKVYPPSALSTNRILNPHPNNGSAFLSPKYVLSLAYLSRWLNAFTPRFFNQQQNRHYYRRSFHRFWGHGRSSDMGYMATNP